MYIRTTDFIANVAAKVGVGVTCEHCRAHFEYTLERTETGIGISINGLDDYGAQERANYSASLKLQNSLESAFDVVPCPNCGMYQAQMVAYLKRAHLKWLAMLGWLVVLIAAVIAFIYRSNFTFASVGAVGVLIGIAMIVFQVWSKYRLNPNQGDPSERIALGRSLAVLKRDEPN